MLFLLAAVLTGTGASWAQTTISTFSMPPTNPTPAWDGSDIGSDGYVLDQSGTVKYYAQGFKDASRNFVYRDLNGQRYFKLQENDIEKAHIKILFPAGTIKPGDVISITCVQVYGSDSGEEIGYEMGGSGTEVKGNSSTSAITLSHTLTRNEIIADGDNEYIRIGRWDYKQSAYGNITITRSHINPTIALNSSAEKLILLNESVTLNATPSGEPDVFTTWSRYTKNSDGTFTEAEHLGYSPVTFTPNEGLKKTDGTVVQSGYGTYYIGARAQQNCWVRTGTGDQWEFSQPQIYTINVGVQINVNTYPAGLENTIKIHQKDQPTWIIDNGQVVGRYTTAVFNANVPTGYTFLGWYLGDEKLSDQTSYLFTKHSADGNVNSDITITAKYDGGRLPSDLEMVHQPIHGENHANLAKEYITFAKLPADYYRLTDEIPTSCTASSLSGIGVLTSADHKNTNYRNNLCYILGSDAYKVDSEKGLCISQYGKAGVQAGQVYAPTKAALAMKVAGTVDFYLLAKNYLETQSGGTYGHDRRHIKIWYKNDQSAELKPLNCTNEGTNDYYFYGERFEDNQKNGLSPLSFGVRLQHLGKDGTCDIYVTYESDEADEMVWIKGILVKRPDLKVTIGRTDKLRYNGDSPNHKNSTLSPFGENQPYQWNFGTAGFKNTHPDDIEAKKQNKYDGRTYICGVAPNGDELKDHLLVYSDAQGQDKAEFDGRPSNGKHSGYEDDDTDNNEHIEFNHPTVYTGNNAMGTHQDGYDENRRSFYPILSNGLKVNVTGSGWFSIACSAPNGPVRVKILSSCNRGDAYINLLREFDVVKNEGGELVASSSATDWKTYRVYLKAHNEHDGSQGFWDGNRKTDADAQLDPEDTQMSLYVVFDKIDGVSYKDNGVDADAQLNIHYMQWANEWPADYVYQREEDPRLLNSLQSIVSAGSAEKPGLYWQAGTSLVEGQKSITPALTKGGSTGSFDSAFNSAEETHRVNGQNSGWDNRTQSQSASSLLGGEWNAAAQPLTVAHSEKAYADTEAAFNADNEYKQTNADKLLEFGLPMSGSFYRFMPMKNEYVSAFIVPEENKAVDIYVLDETGKPIPFRDGADAQDANKSKLTPEAREHGWVNCAVGLTWNDSKKCFEAAANASATRIDFAALAGKEYFICSNNNKISLARLNATNNAYRAAVEEVETALTLNNDAADNTTVINNAMSGTGRYLSESKPVTLNRTFTANQWASLVLPFSMNEEKFKQVFGNDAICLHFTDVDKTTNTVNLTHHFYNMIVAGRPVLVRPSSDGSIFTSKTISDVTLQASTVNTVTNDNGFTFTGSMDNATMPANSLFVSGNAVKHASAEKTGVKALRAWFVCPGLIETPSASGARAAVFVNYDGTLMDEDMATGIESALAESGMDAAVINASTVIYNLQGNKVATGAEMQNLPAGVYVVKGKKFIVK